MAAGWPTALRARFAKPAAARTALRAAVVVPANFAIGSQLIGNAQTATFAAFGSFALLLFANFPGSRAGRTAAYGLLALVSAGLIVVGTLLATPDWLAVLVMLVVGFAVQFSGVVSSVVNGGTSAALLTLILSILLPGARGDLGYRLLGWALACAVAIPVALLVWPPQDQNALRTRTAQLCRSLAAMLRLDPPAPGEPDPLVAMRQAARDLRDTFRSSVARTSGLSTGARLLVRLVDELEWLAGVVTDACADAPDGWPAPSRRLREAAAGVLASSADALAHTGAGPSASACTDLDACLTRLAAARTEVARHTLDSLRARAMDGPTPGTAGEFGRPLVAAHELGYAVELAGRTVAVIAAADARSWWSRLLGRRVAGAPAAFDGIAGAAQRTAAGHLDRHSVWLQSSVRAATGLALAVLLARVSGSQNAFWIGLGALSVLRSNALSTGATVLRAIAGTLLGFAVGGALVFVIGTQPAVLWPLLPVAVFVAAFAPAVISFAAGQAAFTLFSIILFNIIAPLGWRVGVLRVEDVALGCAASLVAGVLFWPRGAGAALGSAYAEAYASAARYLRDAVDALTGRVRDEPGSGAVATAAGLRLDDALRQYLAEQGGKAVPLESVAALANGATRLRLAGAAVDALRAHAPDGAVVAPGDERLAAPADVLDRRAHLVAGWYESLAASFAGGPPPGTHEPDTAESFLDVVLPAVDRCGDPTRADRAERLLWSGQYLGDVDRVRAQLAGPAALVTAAQHRPLWRR